MQRIWLLSFLATCLVTSLQAHQAKETAPTQETGNGLAKVMVTNGTQSVPTGTDGTNTPLPDLKTFTDLTKIMTGPILQDTFDRGNQGWDLKGKFTLAPRMGLNGTTALAYTRTDPDDYPILCREVDMKENTLYTLSFHFRTEGMIPPKGKTQIRYVASIEYLKGEKWLSGVMSDSRGTLPINQTWKEVVLETMPPQGQGMDRCKLMLFLEHGYQGTIYYDNISLTPQSAVNAEIYATRPANLTLDDEGRIEFRATIFGNNKPSTHDLAMMVEAGGRRQLLKQDNSGAFIGRFGKFPQGKIPVKAQLLNMKAREIIACKGFNLFAQNRRETIAGASHIDRNGFLRLNGKKVLPIGFFGDNLTPNDMKRLQQASVNVYMPYTSMFMAPDGSYVNSFNKVAQTMDLFHQHDLKVLFALNGQNPSQGSFCRREYDGVKGIQEISKAFIRRLRKHPAMMGYYVSDENPVNELPYIRSIREMAAELDPQHLSVTLTFIPNDFPAYAHTGDVLAVDSYPIDDSPDPSMNSIYQVMDVAMQLGIPVWFVPQAFSWGCFKNLKPGQTEAFKRWPFPTETQLRAMTLAGAVAGAKGFLFYCYNAIFQTGEKFLPGSGQRNWQRIETALAVIKKLEPFLLSEDRPPEMSVKEQPFKHKVRARAWKKNHDVRIIVTGNGPGIAQAKLYIPDYPNLRSKYGLTKNLGNGNYRFSCKGIDADILMNP